MPVLVHTTVDQTLVEIYSTLGATDHGALTGLTDDDHPQYLNQERGDSRYSLLGHNHEHGLLTGLLADDHPQYFNQERGDARYAELLHVHDHSELTGLDDDDHPQYLTQARADALYVAVGSGGVTDHGTLSGLADDDHPQYLNQVRGDARYAFGSHTHAHAILTDLDADDHPQYLTAARGDARYDIRYALIAHNHAASEVISGVFDPARLGSGTANATKVLLGDSTWGSLPSSAAWGSITGTLSAQTDLQTALNGKANLSTNNTFTSGQFVSGASPWWGLQETDQAVDEKYWLTHVNAKAWTLRMYDDALSGNRIALSATRGTGIAIASMAYGNATDLPSHTFHGSTTINQGATSFALDLKGADAGIRMYENDAPVDEKYWKLTPGSGDLQLSILNDSAAGAVTVMRAYRSAMVIDSVDWTATAMKLNGVSIRDAAIINTGVMAPARLGTGAPSSSNFLRGDGTWDVPAGGGGGVTDHGALTGLADDDHPQYLTQARGDLIYAPIGGGGGGSVATDTLWDAKGDLALGTGANTAARLALGGDGQVLMADSTQATGAKWATPTSTGTLNDGAFVRNTVGQVISHGVITPVTFNTEVRDDGDYFNLGTSASRMVIKNAGWYALSGTVSWPPMTNNNTPILIIMKNGTERLAEISWFPADSTKPEVQTATAIAYFAAGDYAELTVFHFSGANRTLVVTDGFPAFSIHRLSGVGVAMDDGATVYRAASAQSVANNTVTAVTFDTEVRDDGSYATLGTSNDRLIVAKSGWYVVSGSVQWGASSANLRGTFFRINGDSAKSYGQSNVSNVNDCQQSSTTILYLNAGDYVQLFGYQNSGSAMTLAIAGGLPYLSIHRLGGGGNRIVGAGVGPAQGWEILDDFLGQVYSTGVGGRNWDSAVSGGTVTYSAGEANAPGILNLRTANGTADTAGVIYGSLDASGAYNGPIKVGGGEIVFEARVRVNAVPDGTNGYSARIGLGDDANGPPTDGIYISTSGSNANWVAINRAAGVSTSSAAIGTVLTNTWQYLKIVINAAGTSVDFYIDGALLATVATGIPTVGMSLMLSIQKTAGTTLRMMDVDVVRCYQVLSTPRLFGGGAGGFVADHGLLSGLTDDDHPQYLTNARGDARYALTADVARYADASAIFTGGTLGVQSASAQTIFRITKPSDTQRGSIEFRGKAINNYLRWRLGEDDTSADNLYLWAYNATGANELAVMKWTNTTGQLDFPHASAIPSVGGVSVRDAALFNTGTLADARLSSNILKSTNTAQGHNTGIDSTGTYTLGSASAIAREQRFRLQNDTRQMDWLISGDGLTTGFYDRTQNGYLFSIKTDTKDATFYNKVNATTFSEGGTNLNAKYAALSHVHAGGDITTGTVADARLSANVPLLNVANTFTVPQKITADAATNNELALQRGAANKNVNIGLFDEAGTRRYWLGMYGATPSFAMFRYDAAGVSQGAPLSIDGATGLVTIAPMLQAANIPYGDTSVATTQMVSTYDPYHVSQYRSGFWDVNGVAWTPNTNWWWCLNIAHRSNTTSFNYSGQLGMEQSGNELQFRCIVAGTPQAWRRVYHSGNMTKGTAAPSGGSDGDVYMQYV